MDEKQLIVANEIVSTLDDQRTWLKHVLVNRETALVTNGHVLYSGPTVAGDGFYKIVRDPASRRLQLHYVGELSARDDADSPAYAYPKWEVFEKLMRRPTIPFYMPKPARRYVQKNTPLSELAFVVYRQCESSWTFQMDYLALAVRLKRAMVRVEIFDESMLAIEYDDSGLFIQMAIRKGC